MKKKLTALALVIVMVAMLFTGLTMAYFTNTDEATNTFTVGSVEIKLDEAPVDPETGKEISGDRVQENQYNTIVPGIEYDKDPIVHNTGKSDAYVRAKVTITEGVSFLPGVNVAAGGTGDYSDSLYIDAFMALINNTLGEGWEIVSHDDIFDSILNGKADITFVIEYSKVLEKGKDTTPVFETIGLPAQFGSNDYMPEEFKVTVVAEAIQADGLTQAEAMAILDNAGDPLTAVEVEVTGASDEEKAASLAANLTANSNAQKIVVNDTESVWKTGAGHGSTPLVAENADTQVVEFNGGTFKATGSGVGPIRAANEGTLVFKNMTIVDESVSYAEDSWEFGYLEFDGNLYFENCTFKNAIMVSGDATFVNCTFNSNKDNEYAVWVDGGSASFSGCTFEGARGLKMHEAYGTDVKSVIVDDCTFDTLTKKPGVAIGDLEATTVVTIKNSEFINCQAGDQGLYIYETDTDVTTFVFTESGNTVTNS